ncbi:unnamed protein product [Blepharisma stoltei]|uniref:Gem-associated protein 2 n=1 Tax=Blepharisma stoltei TaxID=1481888 RepID=A0AAU9IF79_9CILI|nr:unnamed protein product [Blepharisma stoltei]
MNSDESLNPVLVLSDSDEDEASMYLRSVMNEAKDYEEKSIYIEESMDCEQNMMSESQIPKDFVLNLTNEQIEKINQDFRKLREYLFQWKQNAIENETKPNKEEWRNFMMNNDPLLDKIKEIDHVTTLKLVKWLSDWVENDFENLGKWVYAILANLEEPLSPDTAYFLNKIMITCINNSPKPLSLLCICLITTFFGQKLHS